MDSVSVLPLIGVQGDDISNFTIIHVEITCNYDRSLSFITEGSVIDLITYDRTNKDC